MSWTCTMLERVQGESPWRADPPIGSLWYDDAGQGGTQVSADYLAHRQGQPPLWIQLPGGPFCLDGGIDDTHDGWTWTGTPPNITANPSFNRPGTWHGFVRNGEVTDDIEGHPYPPTST